MTTETEIGSEELEDKEFSQQGEAESVEDTIMRSIEELQDGDTEADENLQGNEGQSDQEAKNRASEAARVLAAQKKPKKQVIEAKDLQPEKGVKKGKQQGDEGQPSGDKLEAPIGWDVKDKEEFAKLPEPAKRQSLAFWGRLNKVFTQGTQEISRFKQKYGGLDEVENYYRPHLDQHKMDFVQGTRELWATHHKLVNDTDNELLRIIERSGRSLESLYNIREGRAQPSQQRQPQAQNSHLTPDVVSSIVRQELQGYQTQQATRTEAEELDTVRNEVGPDGQYLYPELWDSENMDGHYWNQATIDRVKPLYESLKMTQPELNHAERLKRAVHFIRFSNGQVPSSPAPSAQRLPQNANTSEIAKARAASVSIRSRGNHSLSSTSQAPAGETVEQSIERAIAELGGNSRY